MGIIQKSTHFTRKFSSTSAISLIETVWEQPVLAANGTLGSNEELAVESSSEYGSYSAFKAFDNTTSTIWAFASGVSTGTLIMYTVKPTRVSYYSITNHPATASSHYFSIPRTGAVYGSNDNSTWTKLCDWSSEADYSATWTLTVGSHDFYNYHKLEVTSSNRNYCSGANEISINATYLSSGQPAWWGAWAAQNEHKWAIKY